MAVADGMGGGLPTDGRRTSPLPGGPAETSIQEPDRRVAMALAESGMTRLAIAELLLISSHQVDQLLISPTPQPLGL